MTEQECSTDPLERALDHLRHLLPDQGPIGVFIHHNTLHAFQRLPFHEAVQEAAHIYGAEPYWPAARYRSFFAIGRIEERDLRESLGAFEEQLPPERKGPPQASLPREGLRWLLARHGAEVPPPSALRWWKSERGKSPLDEDLCAVCEERCRRLPRRSAAPPRLPVRMRDALLARCGVDLDELVHPLLIRWIAAYLDEGVAYWPMPRRREGFFRATLAQWASKAPGLEPWHREVRQEARRLLEVGASPGQVVRAVAEEFGVEDEELAVWLQENALALRGWAGMVSRLERHPEDRSSTAPPASLVEFLAILSLLQRHAARWVAGHYLRHRGPLASLRRQLAWERGERGAYEAVRYLRLARLLGLAGLDAEAARKLSGEVIERALEEIELFDDIAQRRVLHEAYEGTYRRGILDAVASNRPADQSRRSPRFQAIFCFDEREESFRRHLEEAHPEFETFGAPGFFGMAMLFQGIDDAGTRALCPVALRPRHAVREVPAPEHREALATRRARSLRRARIEHLTHTGARSLLRGALVSLVGGFFSAFPLLARVLVPRATARLLARSQRLWLPRGETTQTMLRVEGETLEGLPLGFTPEELAERVGNLLENIGLTRGFSPLVVMLGHGATTSNNPHASAYNCGACGGHHGDASARLFAAAANNPQVRGLLRARGIDVPETTWFLGGYHDTCSDDLIFFDEDRAPGALQRELGALKEALADARSRASLERCRRFEAAEGVETPEEALHHVEERAHRLDEPRPEFGHATNAVAIVGRRELTRGLFLDRRAFLISYDPTIDGDGRVLERLLAAASPVGAGINLEYYFSCVDNEVYGCGTKLPHNLVGLLGVMNGHAGDLRTGLPLQTVEIHEPMRLLMVVEATPERLLDIAGRQPEVRELVVNEWVQLVAMDPESGALWRFQGGTFRRYLPGPPPPAVPSSEAWFRGHRGHLPPCVIRPEGAAHAA